MFDFFINESGKQKLIEFLFSCYPQQSKNSVRSFLKNRCVSVEGCEVVQPHITLKEGAKVCVLRKKRNLIKDVEVIFEDKDFAVINKPCGLLSVADDQHVKQNLHSLLKKSYAPKNIFVVHRLDKGTSGLILFAKTLEMQKKLKKLLENHEISREYYGVIEGHLPEKKGTWESYLYEDGYQIMRTTSDPKRGKKAITHYEVIREKGKSSLVKFSLETGRKNQIRVHCAQAGTPLRGDKKYGHGKGSKSRLCLHAFRLCFISPKDQKKFDLSIPMPQEFYKNFFSPKEWGFEL